MQQHVRKGVAAVGRLGLGLAVGLAGLLGLIARAQASQVPAGVRIVPGSQHEVSGFAASADGQTVAYSLAKSCGYKLCARYPTFVARQHQLVRIDERRYQPLGGIALAGDGLIAAYPASDHGRAGTVLYDLVRRHSHFVPGFVLMPAGAPYAAMSQTGRYLLGERGNSRSLDVYDVDTGRFVPLPKPPKPFIVAVPEFLSSDGHTVLLTDDTPLKGFIAQTLLFSVTTRHSTVLSHSDPFHHPGAYGLGLSANGRLALVAGQPAGSMASAQATLFDSSDQSFTPLFPDPTQFSFVPIAVSLTGDGQTIAFSCADSFYLYRPASSEIFRVLASFDHGKDPVRGYVTSNGNAIIFGIESSDTTDFRSGLFVVSTAGAKSIGTSFPAGCAN